MGKKLIFTKGVDPHIDVHITHVGMSFFQYTTIGLLEGGLIAAIFGKMKSPPCF